MLFLFNVQLGNKYDDDDDISNLSVDRPAVLQRNRCTISYNRPT